MEDPLSEEILRGNFKGKDLVKISVKAEDGGEKHLFFEAIKTTEEEEGRGRRTAGDIRRHLIGVACPANEPPQGRAQTARPCVLLADNSIAG